MFYQKSLRNRWTWLLTFMYLLQVKATAQLCNTCSGATDITGSTGIVTLSTGDYCINGAASFSMLDVQGDARLYLNENATLNIGGNVSLGTTSASQPQIYLCNNARLTINGTMAIDGDAIFNIQNGASVLVGGSALVGGTAELVADVGAVFEVCGSFIKNTTTAVMRCTSGGRPCYFLTYGEALPVLPFTATDFAGRWFWVDNSTTSSFTPQPDQTYCGPQAMGSVSFTGPVLPCAASLGITNTCGSGIIILPVNNIELTYQPGSAGNVAQVHWRTVGTNGIKLYTLERSVDGSKYEDVCTINAHHEPLYSCAVPLPSAGVARHLLVRVKAVDKQGLITYSKLLPIPLTAGKWFVAAAGSTRVITVAAYHNLQALSVLGTHGSLLAVKNNITAGVHTIMLAGARPGEMVFVKATTTQGTTITQKLILP